MGLCASKVDTDGHRPGPGGGRRSDAGMQLQPTLHPSQPRGQPQGQVQPLPPSGAAAGSSSAATTAVSSSSSGSSVAPGASQSTVIDYQPRPHAPQQPHPQHAQQQQHNEQQQQNLLQQQQQQQEESPELQAYLQRVPLLMRLSAQNRSALARALEQRTYADKQAIVLEGDVGSEFFLLKQGRARVLKEGVEVGVLSPGDYFGETALLTNSPRAATIVADGTPVVCYVLGQVQFHAMFGSVTFAKRAGISAEASSSHSDSSRSGGSPRAGGGGAGDEHKANGGAGDGTGGGESPFKKQSGASKDDGRNRVKSPEIEHMIMDVVKDNILFVHLSPEQRQQIVHTMYRLEVDPAGGPLISQGELGDHFYIVEKGRFDIYVNGGQQPVASRGPGSSFGELALMYNAPRAATVVPTEPSAVWAMDRWTFRKVLTKLTQLKLQEYERFLATVETFQVLTSWERSKIAEALEEVSFPEGHEIVRQGEEGEVFFFIVQAGQVLVTKDMGDGAGPREVARYGPGDTFGERALLTKEPRAASVTALGPGPVRCLYLNQASFVRLLGPLEDIFQKRAHGYRELDQELASPRAGSSAPGSPNGASAAAAAANGGFAGALRTAQGGSGSGSSQTATRDVRAPHMRKTDFRVMGTLGKGSFGHVELVKDASGRAYALKAVRKSQIVALGQQGHIMSEKRVMACLDHPFLVKLHATFQDRNFLYFVLEPSLGGELFTVLRRKTYFSEPTARFYAAAVVLAFEYLHSKDFIYRDLKPENLLLDAQGYLKITDFGFAKLVKDRTYTLCGTPDYLAPEVVSGQGHGKPVDWWTLGVLIYEMLASYPPFYDEDPMKTYAKIMQGHVSYPMHFSKPAVDLVRRLLQSKPHKRLGVGRGGVQMLKAHPWFAGFDWDAYLAKQIPAPIILPVKSDEDLSNFEDYGEEEEVFPDYVPDPANPNWDEDF